jgi:uncharacterized repeat protein (TIGR03803 family)
MICTTAKLPGALLATLAITAALGSTAVTAAPVVHPFNIIRAFSEPNSTQEPVSPRSLIRGRDGAIYGAAHVSGSFAGVMFKIRPWLKGDYAEYFRFSDGANSEGNEFVYPRFVTQARNSSFYVSGLGQGISAGPESLYKITSLNPPQSSVAGVYPTWRSDAPFVHRPLEAANGKFYTTTVRGGDLVYSDRGDFRSGGTLVELDPNNPDLSANVNILHRFDLVNGANPHGGLVSVKGQFYGTTCSSAQTDKDGTTPIDEGVIYRFDPTVSVNNYAVIHRFDSANGACPEGELLKASNGKLYGVTSAGGLNGKGVIFELDIRKATPKYRVLYHFDGASGETPLNTLVQSTADFNLYGTTSAGGINGKGVVFKLELGSPLANYTAIVHFDGVTNGENPGNLTTTLGGNLFGTSNGGPNGGGVIYRIGVPAREAKK